MTISEEAAVEKPSEKKGGRPGRTPGIRRPPKHAPRSVSEIWNAAAGEEREAARQAATELLSYWRGLAGSAAVAKALGVKRNRVYLMQQRALAGMAAGLLPPRKSPSAPGAERTLKAENDRLRKEVERLTRERDSLQSLVRLMRTLPSAARSDERAGHEGKTGASKARGRGGTEKHRGVVEEKRTRQAGSGEARDRAQGIGADAAKLGKEE